MSTPVKSNFIVDRDAAALGLKVLIDCQAVVSAPIPGALNGSRETLVAYAYSLIEEVQETLREVGVKPWKKAAEPDVARVVEETADILAFLGILLINLAKACELDPEDFAWMVATQYQKTSQNNFRRFEHGLEKERVYK